MVVATMPWLSNSIKGTHHHHHHHNLQFLFQHKSLPSSPTLGILSFDTAKTMSSLISLYRSLADDEILKLKNETLLSQGVVYLNSRDEEFLLNLASAERLEELNNAAASVSRLSKKCSDLGLMRFDLVFSDMKLGIFHSGMKMEFCSRHVAKLIGRMEKLVSSTAGLHSAMEGLIEMEASEKKLQRWKSYTPKLQQCHPVNFEMFDKKIASQRKDVKHYKETSLWNQSFDYVVGLMTRLVGIIYVRICNVFGHYIPGQVCLMDHQNHNHSQSYHHRFLREPVLSWNLHSVNRKFRDNDQSPSQNQKHSSRSGPILKSAKELVRFPSGSQKHNDIETGTATGCVEELTTKKNVVYHLAASNTVGGSGLSIHYANVVLFAERCLHTPATIGEEARGELYEMLPAKIKATVRAKLRKNNLVKRGEEEMENDGHSLAEGWREALEEMMGWLVPLANDTLRWQSERNFEKQRFDRSPTVLLMQTLHYSDLEKTEAAIVEVLVGLSYIFRYENLRRPGPRSKDRL